MDEVRASRPEYIHQNSLGISALFPETRGSCNPTEALGKQSASLLLFTFLFFKETILPLDQMPVPNRVCPRLSWIHSLNKSLFSGN